MSDAAGDTPPDDEQPSTTTVVSGETESSPSYTYVADWTWMEHVSDQAFRYYACVRSFIFDKQPTFEVQITDETAAKLLHRSVKSVARARKECVDKGLIEEVEIVQRSVAVPGQARREVRTYRTLRVHHQPRPGHVGPVNCFDAKRRIEGEHKAKQDAARAERQGREHPAADTTTGTTAPAPDSPNVSSQAHQAHDDVSPAQPASPNLSPAEPDLSPPDPNSSPARTHPDQPAPHLAPPTSADLGQPTPQEVDQQTLLTNDPAPSDPAPTPAVTSPEQDGGVDGLEEGGPLARAQALLASLPTPWTLGKRATDTEAPKVATLLAAGWTEAQLTERWTAARANNPPGALRFRIGDTPALPPGRAPAAAGSAGVDPWCGTCGKDYPDEFARNNTRHRVVPDPQTGRPVPCQNCHPARHVPQPERSAS